MNVINSWNSYDVFFQTAKKLTWWGIDPSIQKVWDKRLTTRPHIDVNGGMKSSICCSQVHLDFLQWKVDWNEIVQNLQMFITCVKTTIFSMFFLILVQLMMFDLHANYRGGYISKSVFFGLSKMVPRKKWDQNSKRVASFERGTNSESNYGTTTDNNCPLNNCYEW